MRRINFLTLHTNVQSTDYLTSVCLDWQHRELSTL